MMVLPNAKLMDALTASKMMLEVSIKLRQLFSQKKLLQIV